MATKPMVKTAANSKIRFIMLEADLPDGDLSQVTQAITQALRQTQPAPRQLVATTARASVDATAEASAAEPEPDEANTELEAPGESAAVSKPRAQRRFPTPKVLADVDLNSGEMPFEKFANEKSPTTALHRYLLVAYWFKKYRNTAAVNFNHVFTCYKKMGWGTDIKDFAQPLRDNAYAGRGEMERGHFSINHIGEDAVEKMTAE